MWQISYPPANGASFGSNFLLKNLTSASKHCLNKPISPFFEEEHMEKGRENTGLAAKGAEIYEMYEGRALFVLVWTY